MLRQGDVLIIPAKLPKTAVPLQGGSDRLILAEGEATGHAHAIKSERAALFRDPKLMAMFLTVTEEPVALEHDEHAPVMIPPGTYEVRRQREYTPEAIRNVAD